MALGTFLTSISSNHRLSIYKYKLYSEEIKSLLCLKISKYNQYGCHGIGNFAALRCQKHLDIVVDTWQFQTIGLLGKKSFFLATVKITKRGKWNQSLSLIDAFPSSLALSSRAEVVAGRSDEGELSDKVRKIADEEF